MKNTQLVIEPAFPFSLSGGDATVVIQTQETLEPKHINAMVRRDKSADGWRISDEDHTFFADRFHSGVMVNGRLVNQAPPMTCQAGYDSTGEAVGNIYEVDEETLKEAFDLDFMAEIHYDKQERVFRYVISAKPIEEGEFTWIVFLSNGTAYLKK